MNLKEAIKLAVPFLHKEGTVTVVKEKTGHAAVYVGNTVDEMKSLCAERGWELFVIRNNDQKPGKEQPVVETKEEKVVELKPKKKKK